MNFVTVQSKCKGHAVIKWNIKNLNFIQKPYKLCCLGSISVELIVASLSASLSLPLSPLSVCLYGLIIDRIILEWLFVHRGAQKVVDAQSQTDTKV